MKVNNDNIFLELMEKLEKKVEAGFSEVKQEIKDLKNEIKNEYAKKYVELQLEEQKRRVRKLEDWQLKAITIATLFASLFGFLLNKFL